MIVTEYQPLPITDTAMFNASLVRLKELCDELSIKPSLLNSECRSVVELTTAVAGFVREQAILGNDSVVEQWIEFLAMDEV